MDTFYLFIYLINAFLLFYLITYLFDNRKYLVNIVTNQFYSPAIII